MTEIFNLSQIKEALKNIDPIQAIEEGFFAYSQGKVVVPPDSLRDLSLWLFYNQSTVRVLLILRGWSGLIPFS